MPDIKPIQTKAYGRRFRSRLEARWAVFLTSLGVRWEYEAEGFQTDAGPYLPDFWLPEIRGGVWLEIKPHGAGDQWNERLAAFDEQTGGGLLFVAHGLAEPNSVEPCKWSYGLPGWISGCGEENMMFCICPICGKVGIEFDGRAARIDNCDTTQANKPWVVSWGHDDKAYNSADPRIVQALIAAHSARFEHGESPVASSFLPSQP
jgi:hypothetical protein